MSFLRGLGSPGLGEPDAGSRQIQQELRRTVRDDRLGTGTLACRRCDAPVAIGEEPVVLTASLTCPYCDHQGPVRDFLSLKRPTRPTRVVIRVALPR